VRVLVPEPVASVRAAAEIRMAILDGSLPPGVRVRQEELAAQLGLSREPVRQALAVLEQEGLVHNGVRRRAVIAPIDPALIAEIYEFREVIDAYAAERACGTDFDPKPLRAIVVLGRKAVQAASLGKLIELDLRFHNELYRASANRVVMEVMRAQWSHIRRAMMMTLTAKEYRARVWDEHQAILDAIMARNISRAGKMASEHARNARLFVTGNLGKIAKQKKDGRL
jgi:DNA-binding GntR family transcriptional regulator